MAQESDSIIDECIRSEMDEDYISKLPDDVLRHILLIHPLDSGSKAVALLTGLFDRPWISTVKTQDIESVIADFLVRFEETNPVKTPRKLEFHQSKDLIMTVLPYGSKRKLNLDFSKGYQELPRLFWWDIVLNTRDLAHSSPYPSFVRTLRLTSVNSLSCELVSSLISKFRHLRSLIIEKCDGLRILRVEGLTKLMYLTILDCVDLEYVYVVASELRSLWYRGCLCSFSFKHVMRLKNVTLDFKGPGFNQLHRRFYNLVYWDIQYVKALTLHGWKIKEGFRSLLPSKKDFRLSNLQDLWWIDSCMEDDNINTLFAFLKFCKSLKRLFISIDTCSYLVPCVDEHESTTAVQKGQLHKLKLVRMEGFDKELDIMLFKEHLMEVFNVEPYVVEVRKGMPDRYLFKIPKRQAKDKAPESRKLKFNYRFVDIIEDAFLSSKHPHMP